MTTYGLHVDLAFAEKFLPGEFHLQKAEGKLFSHFTLHGLTYQDVDKRISLKTVSVTWRPIGLLRDKWLIDSLQLDHAEMTFKKNASQSDNSTPLNFNFLQRIVFKHLVLNQVKINYADAQIDLNGTIEKKFNLTWRINFPHLDVAIPNASGLLSTSGSISGPLFTPTLQAMIHGEKLVFAEHKIERLNSQITIIAESKINSTITVSATGLTINHYPLKKLDVTITGNFSHKNKIVNFDLAALIDHQYHVLAKLSLPKFSGVSDINQPVRGNIITTLSNLDVVTQFIPQIKKPQGTLQATIQIDGTLNHPQITSELNLKNGRLSLPMLGLTLHDINLQGQSNNNLRLDFSGSLASGKGIAEVQGNVDFNQSDYPVTLKLKGRELQAVLLDEYKIIISPDVTLRFANQNLQLQGKIFIPVADITPKNLTTSVTLPSEVVFVGTTTKKITLPFTTTLQLNLQLGDKIHIAEKNLETHLGGTLLISQSIGTLINATGQLYAINGTYKAYGQTLQIQNGRLIYTGGSLMNPGLNISAVKQIKTVNLGGNTSSFTGTTGLQAVYTGTETITAGVQVTGTLDNPTFTLISTPTLSQGDILSYLVLGFPQSSASGHQYGALLSALSSLNPNSPSVDGLTKKVEEKFGLSEVNVGSTQVFNPTTNSAVSTTTVAIGKQIAPNLYLHYSVGLFYPVSILNLRYQFSKHWAVQSETSTIDNGADILYGIERD
ncbi:MAG: translocation/assembly module TamB domain-containing protein [Gammaproteobacteria bacterium]